MTLFQAFGQFAGQAALEINSFDLIASASGTTVSSMSIDNCFSADYDVYLMYYAGKISAANTNVSLRLRSAGSDATTSYRRQYLGSGVSQDVGQNSMSGALGTNQPTYSEGAQELILMNPFRAEWTSGYVSIVQSSTGTQVAYNIGFEHTVTSSYDGCTILPNSGTLTGTVYVYGWKVA